MLHLEHSFVLSWNLDISENKSEIPEKFQNVVLEMEKVSGTNRVRNEGVSHRVKEERIILQTILRRKSNWIGQILHRNCLLKHVVERKIEGRIQVMERCGRKHNKLLDDIKEKIVYWKLK
jgi:hypothetical protein